MSASLADVWASDAAWIAALGLGLASARRASLSLTLTLNVTSAPSSGMAVLISIRCRIRDWMPRWLGPLDDMRGESARRRRSSRAGWEYSPSFRPLPAAVRARELLGNSASVNAASPVISTRRRVAERMAWGLHGRLIRAHEEERARLARELHDDRDAARGAPGD